MPTFNYFPNIPNAPNAPSRDQPKMQTITNSIRDIIDVDHYTFQQSNQDGWHRKTFFPQRSFIGGITGVQGVAATAAGTASAASNYIYKNADAVYALNTLRAWGVFTSPASPGAAFNADMGMNLANNSIQYVSDTGTRSNFTITLAPGVVTGDNIALFLNLPNSSVFTDATVATTFTYSFTNPVISISFRHRASNVKYSFAVLQI